MPLFFCDSAEIQTRNLLIRSQMLYSVKLRNRTLSQANKENRFFFVFFRIDGKKELVHFSR